MRDDNCIFCKLANGDIPTNTIYEVEVFRVLAFMFRRIMEKQQDRRFFIFICT